MTPLVPLDRGIEAVVRRERIVVALSLALIVLLAWLYLIADAAHMNRAAPPATTSGDATFASAVEVAAVGFLMWSIMTIGMMLPGAAPTVLLYAALARKSADRRKVLPSVSVFVAGYLVVWIGFSLAAALMQLGLERAALVSPTSMTTIDPLGGLVLIATGIYQWSRPKSACLIRCRNPLEFFLIRWRVGAGGAFRMGVEHGAFCLGCCWLLMLLLFVTGVMNLIWVAVIAGFILVEKLLATESRVSSIAGFALVAIGLYHLAVQ